ncbi:MAG: Peptidase M10A and M12B matrixin and adamalysin [candidate division WWE3 bacterium GW2011_GWA1_41_8]|uniref:Peptidase M10A and M12B matrixin and adamalysin n=2 Tax=Katanobacteria TaxID=422282 RepID=A0A0G1ABY8_UNCKA|nr:MAG: Peptidase M10A and M12B matrixin and adamalysin [candidate division WWE3 bacterium GW2011_GWB1_41_6]KKS22793.1 MAG: Peptidase M10A and M12B matrixin and adamalysin [candidate division WWE3 bacterium GW2011_GWA1_41_8]
MKRILLLAIITVSGTFFVSRQLTANASQNMPKGIEDRGPLSKVTFIHYKKEKENAKPPSAGNKKKTDACYTFISAGAKWKKLEPYFVNPLNASTSLSNNAVYDAFNGGVTAWENGSGKDIFGNGTLDVNVVYDPDRVDDKNVAAFGPYGDSRVIAVTTVWGYFSGPETWREIVEWDMLFNTNFKWSISSSDAMDIQNIATHEMGHSAGLGDLYTTSCSIETMYGYSVNGETSKRTLETGDIAGIKSLYN